MGKIQWAEFARGVALCASFVITVGACLGVFQPLPSFDALKKLPVLYAHPVPILPTILIALGMIVWAMEYPLVGIEYFKTTNSYMPKVAFYIPVAVFSMLEAQTTNGGIYLAIAVLGYLFAIRDDFARMNNGAWNRLP